MLQDPLTQLAALSGVEGSSEAEILEVERRLGHALPSTYRRFLAIAGTAAGAFMDGSDFRCRDLPRLQTAARELLQAARADWTLNDGDLVFLMHQGYEFLFLRPVDADDPPVYLYVELDPEPRLIAPTFSSWLMVAVEEAMED